MPDSRPLSKPSCGALKLQAKTPTNPRSRRAGISLACALVQELVNRVDPVISEKSGELKRFFKHPF